MKIAAAQISVKVGELARNLEQHYRMIEQASEQGVELIAFPEMSITGYCREEGKALAFVEDDKRLNKLRTLSQKYQIIIVAGAPIAIEGKLFIGSFVLYPDGTQSIYTKQYLHKGEDEFYDASFAHNPIIKLAEETISLAICADIENLRHPQNARQAGSTLYIPSIFYSEAGIAAGHKKLAAYANEHHLAILMSNFCGEHWNTKSGGKSAFWDQKGNLLASLDNSESLLIVEKTNKDWESMSVPYQKETIRTSH